MKHLSIKRMLSKEYKLRPDDVAQFAVMQTGMSDNDSTRTLEDLINKCIDDEIKSLAIHPDLEREKEEFAVGLIEWLILNQCQRHDNDGRWSKSNSKNKVTTPELIELYKNREI